MGRVVLAARGGRSETTILFPIVLAALAAGLLLSLLFSITVGNADISVDQVYRVVGYELFHVDAYSEFSAGAIHDVVWLIRFPRVLQAAAVGAALSVCGCVMQAIVKNPLADPYILGISSGASLGATAAVMLGVGAVLGGGSIGAMAFLGALLSSFAVLVLSNLGGRATSSKLVLSGMALASASSAFSSFITYIAYDKSAAQQIMFWSMGSMGSASWDKNRMLIPVMAAGILFFCTQYRTLNLMLLGDDAAVTLGTDLHRFRIGYLVVTSVMTGLAVYCAGTIGFVGLIIPHVVRMLFGTDHRRLVPLAALLGGIFLIWADVLSRVILEYSEMPIGILVSIIGAPCFIYLMVRHSYGFGGGVRE